MIPNRLKIVAATGLLIGGLGAAALPRAFADQLPDTTQAPSLAAAAATATPVPGQSGSTTAPNGKAPGFRGGANFTALAQFFGMSTSDLQTAFKNGQSLAQIAQAHGKSTDDLKAFLTSQLKTKLDAAVSAGKMTSQQEQDALSKMSSHLDQMINAKPGSRPSGLRGGGRGYGGQWLQGIAGFLGISQSDLNTALQNGQTLAQIAQAHGKTAADLKAFLMNQASTRIDSLLNANLSHQGRGFGKQPGNRPNPAATATATPSGA
jgi:hypothetical protein